MKKSKEIIPENVHDVGENITKPSDTNSEKCCSSLCWPSQHAHVLVVGAVGSVGVACHGDVGRANMPTSLSLGQSVVPACALQLCCWHRSGKATSVVSRAIWHRAGNRECRQALSRALEVCSRSSLAWALGSANVPGRWAPTG